MHTIRPITDDKRRYTPRRGFESQLIDTSPLSDPAADTQIATDDVQPTVELLAICAVSESSVADIADTEPSNAQPPLSAEATVIEATTVNEAPRRRSKFRAFLGRTSLHTADTDDNTDNPAQPSAKLQPSAKSEQPTETDPEFDRLTEQTIASLAAEYTTLGDLNIRALVRIIYKRRATTELSDKRIYRKLIVKYHPDHCHDDANVEAYADVFQVVKSLYDEDSNHFMLYGVEPNQDPTTQR